MTPEAGADPLWPQLRDFPLDEPGARRPFTRRLAEEKGWSPSYARRIVVEYRRFLYLGARAGHPVSPSGTVDEAWHLHLTYTRSYWEALCGQVLGRPFHHEPSRGGPAEAQRHARMYADTLASYLRLFGETPPAEVWPAPEAPVAAGDRPWRRLALGGAGAVALTLAVACARAFDEPGAAVLGGSMLIVAVGAGAAALLPPRASAARSGRHPEAGRVRARRTAAAARSSSPPAARPTSPLAQAPRPPARLPPSSPLAGRRSNRAWPSARRALMPAATRAPVQTPGVMGEVAGTAAAGTEEVAAAATEPAARVKPYGMPPREEKCTMRRQKCTPRRLRIYPPRERCTIRRLLCTI